MLAALALLWLAPGFAAGTLAQPIISVTNGRDVVVSGEGFSFGEQKLGRTVTRNLSIRNISPEPVTFTFETSTIEGTGFTARLGKTPLRSPTVLAAPVTVTAPPPAPITIRPGKRVRLLVQMNTAAEGAPTGKITLGFVGGLDEPFVFDLSGMVVGPSPRIRASGPAGTIVSDGELSFGQTREGVATDRIVTVRNVGQQMLEMGGVMLTGSGFQVVTQPPSGLAPGKTARIRLRMLATEPDAPEATASIVTNDPQANPFTVTLRGVVVPSGPVVQVTQLGTLIDPGATAEFGTVNAGDEPVQQFLLRNTGQSTLEVGEVTSSSPAFVVVIPPLAMIEPGESSLFFVKFVSSLGSATGTISIPTNTTANNPFTFNVVGVGQPVPDIEVSFNGNTLPKRNGAVDLGGVFPNNPVSAILTIRNAGSATLNLGNVLFVNSPPDFSVLQQPLQATLAPTQSTIFEIQFVSAIPLPQRVTLRIPSNDPNDSPFDIFVQAAVQGDDPMPLRPAPANSADAVSMAIDLDGDAVRSGSVIDFGAGAVEEIVERFFTVTNSGTRPLTLGTPVVQGTGFETGSLPEMIVAPGEETVFSVRMIGSERGPVAAVVVVPTNGSGASAEIVFSVTGRIE